MNEQEVLQIFKDCGAIITDSHIVYTSDKHGNSYINKDAIYPYTEKTSKLCREIAKRFIQWYVYGHEIESVIAPAIGGVILSQWVAYHLSLMTRQEVAGIYAEKTEDGNFVIKRGYDKFVTGKNVLVVEDVLTTGGSAKKVIEATRAIGGNVIGLSVLCNRGGITLRDIGNIPCLLALFNIKMDSWDEEECPFCAQNIPINTDVGRGREYLAHKMADIKYTEEEYIKDHKKFLKQIQERE